MDAQLEHVLRVPLPWRDENLTECGRDPDGLIALTHDEFVARCKEWGKQRTAMVTCMTCLNACQRWLNYSSLVAIIGREAERVGKWNANGEPASRLEQELQALALLVQAHREEFDETVASLGAVVSMDKLRSDRKAKKRFA